MVNGETNSHYGTFIVEIFDYPKIVAHQEYPNTQFIDPMPLQVVQSQIFSGQTNQPVIYTGNQDLSF